MERDDSGYHWQEFIHKVVHICVYLYTHVCIYILVCIFQIFVHIYMYTGPSTCASAASQKLKASFVFVLFCQGLIYKLDPPHDYVGLLRKDGSIHYDALPPGPTDWPPQVCVCVRVCVYVCMCVCVYACVCV